MQTGNAGVLLLVEGTAPSATSGIGKVYVKSSDGLLYYKDDAGNEYSLTSSGYTILAATGTVDDSNMDFVFASKPTEIVVNGISYRENEGWTWSAGPLTASLTAGVSGPVGTGGRIYGRS